MFDAGFSELLLIFVIALLILGPERLPRVAAQLGRWIAKARRTANQLRWQLEREVALDEVYRAQPKKPSGTSTPAPGTQASGTDSPAPSSVPSEAAGAAAPETESDPYDSGTPAAERDAPVPQSQSSSANRDGSRDPGSAGESAPASGAEDEVAPANRTAGAG